MATVPSADGVPTLASDVTSIAASALTLLQSDTYSYFSSVMSPEWGIFKNGQPVVTADTVTALGFKKDWAIADYHVERGAFESYDKVETPFDMRVRFAAGGSAEARQTLLESVAAIASDLNLYDVVTPEAIFQNVNVRHYDFQRTAQNGVGLLVVDVWLQEIRQTVAETGTGSAAPSGASPVNGGTVQPEAIAQGGVSGISQTGLFGSLSSLDGGGITPYSFGANVSGAPRVL